MGESGSRTTIHDGRSGGRRRARSEEADRRQGDAERQRPPHGERHAEAARRRRKIRNCFGANFAEVEVDTELGTVKVLKFVAVHESGRIMNPLTAASQVKGGVAMGVGMALHEDMIYDQRTGRPVVTGYYFDRVVTHLDAPDVEVEFIEADDGYGPYGAKGIGEAGMITTPAAISNAVFNAIGRRIKDLPITRDKILGALA